MDGLLTRKEAAERLGMTTNTLDAERISGRLAYIQRRPGCKVWITEEAIEEYLMKAMAEAVGIPGDVLVRTASKKGA